MTIPEHIEILRRGPRVWNAWRAENPSIVPDLAGIALSIGDRQMGPINGGPINLSRALLNDATLYFATLTGADMRGSDLTNADLRGARLEGVDLTGADLAGAVLDGACLAGAVLKAANLSGASLAEVRDLTTEQIGEAEGNLGTLLPSNLERPAIWSVGQGILHIETAQEAAEKDAAEEATRGDAPMDMSVESTPISFHAEAGPEERPEPEGVDEAEAEAAQGHTATPALAAAAAEPGPYVSELEAPQPKSEPADAMPAQTFDFSPATALPQAESSGPAKSAPEPQHIAQDVSSNGQNRGSEADSNARGDRENKHVSWLVGGPRHAGRPARNWRDRA